MKIAVYYLTIFFVAVALYLAAEKAKKYKIKIMQYFCYFMIFLMVLFLI